MIGEALTAVVTGTANGIGRALAEALHARGARLVLADIDADTLSTMATRLGATGVLADVSDPAAMSALVAQATQARLICLNAGVVGKALGAPWEVPPGEWDRVFVHPLQGVPSSRQRAKDSYTVRQGGKSAGRYRQAQPVRSTYKIASTITRAGCSGGLPRRPGTYPAGAGR